MVKNCGQESCFNISNRIFSTGWSGIPDFFWLRTIYIKISVHRALVHCPRWPTAFKTCIRRFWNFRRFSFMYMYWLLPLPFNSKSWLIRLNNTDQYYFYLPISLYHLLMWNCDEWAHIFPCIRHWLVIIECTQSFIWYTKPYLNLTTCWKVHYITALIEVPFEISLACSCCKFPLFNVNFLIVQVTAVAIWKSRAIL